MRRALSLLLAVGAAALVPAPAGAHDAAPHDAAPGLVPKLPDLVSDAPTHVQIVAANDAVGEPTGRLLLRFDGYVHNRGPGALEMEGRDPSPFGPGLAPPTMGQVTQNIDRGDGVLEPHPSVAKMVYETNDDHRHWHFKEAARYSLWDAAGQGEVAPAQKAGFCLEDSDWIPGEAPEPAPGYVPPYDDASFCQWGNPELKTPGPGLPQVDSVVTGVSPGWRDSYAYTLFFQWVDISDVAPGPYLLHSLVDPNNAIVEKNEVNAPATAPIVIPGYTATPQAATVPHAGPGTVKIAAAKSSSATRTLGPAVYELVEAPAHGTLRTPGGDVLAAGATFTADTLTYTPAGATAEPDRFRFSAREQGSPFPLTAPEAEVALTPGDAPPDPDTVTIGGVQERVVVGTSIQLTAAVSGATARADQVAWQVVTPGGGTVTSAGRYTAPAAVPGDGWVTVRASLPSGAAAETRLRVVAAPANDPAPMPTPPEGVRGEEASPLPGPLRRRSTEKPTPRVPPVLALSTLRRAGYVSVSAAPRYTGRVRLELRVGTRRVAVCTARVRAGRVHVCRLPVAARDERAALRVVGTLKRLTDGRTFVRTTRPGALPKRTAKQAAAAAESAGHVH